MTTAMQLFVPQNLDQLYALCDRLAKSDLMPEALRGKPANIAIVIMTGQELGLGPMLAARTINVVKGKPTLAADLMSALVQRETSVCEYFMPVESTAVQAVYETKRRGAPRPVRFAWTMKMAQAAGLLSNPAWKSYPDAMLRARCITALARAVYPDLVAGIYDPDELGAPSQPTAYVEATVVESEPQAPAADTQPLSAWIFEAISKAETMGYLDELKTNIRPYETEDLDTYKRLVAAWRIRQEQLNPPSRSDALKARMKAAKEAATVEQPATETTATPTEEAKP